MGHSSTSEAADCLRSKHSTGKDGYVYRNAMLHATSLVVQVASHANSTPAFPRFPSKLTAPELPLPRKDISITCIINSSHLASSVGNVLSKAESVPKRLSGQERPSSGPEPTVPVLPDLDQFTDRADHPADLELPNYTVLRAEMQRLLHPIILPISHLLAHPMSIQGTKATSKGHRQQSLSFLSRPMHLPVAPPPMENLGSLSGQAEHAPRLPWWWAFYWQCSK